jgi:hypothetical protein
VSWFVSRKIIEDQYRRWSNGIMEFWSNGMTDQKESLHIIKPMDIFPVHPCRIAV